jgi:glycerol-3-phosphate acyltransferase PlsX
VHQLSKKIKVAVDAMGGDYAPQEIIQGAVMAAKKGNVAITLVGHEAIVERELAKYDVSHLPLDYVSADEVIREGEHPALALRHKPNASIAVATALAKEGEADAVVSAGPTGATMASAVMSIGLIPGIQRPVVCAPLVGFAPHTVLVDVGANVDCNPNHLLSFAVIGCSYAKKLLNIAHPKVALLSVGTEEGKGSKLTQASYPLLESSNLDFIGNIEGGDILSGKANVIVCDGIIGNVILKFYENMGPYIVRWLKDRLGNLPLLGPIKKVLNHMVSFTKMVEDESGCGGLLWGVNSVVQVLHGNSQAQQVSKAIERAKSAVESELVSYLTSELAKVTNKHDTTLNESISTPKI